MTPDRWRISPMQGGADQTAAALALFQTVFGHATTARQWHWKYHQAPNGLLLSHAAHDTATGAMLGHIGALALPGLHQGQAIHMVQFSDVMVHPSARSGMAAGSLYRCLMDSTLRALAALPTRSSAATPVYAYGFPGKTPANLGARLGYYKLLGYCAQHTQANTPRRSLWPQLRHWQLQNVSNASQIPAELLQRTQHAQSGPQLIKDAAYLNWRYLHCPDRSYQLWLAGPRWGRAAAWVVTRAAAPAHLIDIRFATPSPPPKAMPCLVNALIAHTGTPCWTYWPSTPDPSHTATPLMAVEIGSNLHTSATPAPAFQPGDTDMY